MLPTMFCHGEAYVFLPLQDGPVVSEVFRAKVSSQPGGHCRVMDSEVRQAGFLLTLLMEKKNPRSEWPPSAFWPWVYETELLLGLNLLRIEQP